jgi:hypothetical protein
MKRLLLLPLFIAFTLSAGASTRVIHILVALCDNDSQGIVPVPKAIGNGNDPDKNLYWGCGYGIRTFFKQSAEWKLLQTLKNPKTNVLERLIFKHKSADVILVADAYKGARIKSCTIDFFSNASGNFSESITLPGTSTTFNLNDASLVVYVGHDGLMDFSLDSYPKQNKSSTVKKDVMIYACISRSFYSTGVMTAGAYPLIWTTGLMCPEAYTVKAAITGWILNETGKQIHERCAQTYNEYQKCGLKGARGLFYTGWVK